MNCFELQAVCFQFLKKGYVLMKSLSGNQLLVRVRKDYNTFLLLMPLLLGMNRQYWPLRSNNHNVLLCIAFFDSYSSSYVHFMVVESFINTSRLLQQLEILTRECVFFVMCYMNLHGLAYAINLFSYLFCEERH